MTQPWCRFEVTLEPCLSTRPCASLLETWFDGSGLELNVAFLAVFKIAHNLSDTEGLNTVITKQVLQVENHRCLAKSRIFED